ncbi:MAG: ferrochelatase [Chloroflexota bacterium]|nr:MAG: ferrochelatase [Chloroflexota bacterium]
MAYGGPDSLDDVEPYLLDVRGGRPTSPQLVEEIKERYARIGGKSPLLEITRQQAQSLQQELDRRVGDGLFRTYVGMRHWAPRIREAVEQIHDDGIRHIAAMVMAPHYSSMSTEVYLERLREAIGDLGGDIEVTAIRSWHDHPGLVAAIAGNARQTIDRFEGSSPFVLFSAHSLPSRILARGDPYADQLNQTAQLVAQELNLPGDRWSFCFQSAGRTQEPWLGPSIEAEIPRLVELGEKNILVTPVGFVADHVEVLYDVDIEAAGLVSQAGARLERTPSLNASPAFISALASIILDHLDLSNR